VSAPVTAGSLLPISDFAAWLESLGLRPRGIAADGRWRRCPTESHPRKKNGAYCLAPDGRIGWAQDWATMDEPATWRPDAAEAPALPDYREIRQRNEAEKARRTRAIAAARAFYERCSALVGGHPYLEAHGLDMTGCRGLKRDPRGRLLVPMGRRGALLSLQRIDAAGEKRFWPGAPTAGTSLTLERPRAALTVLCEGLATGLALYAAVPQARVVVAFTSGNLARIARELPRRGMAVVAADNDHATAVRIGRNPGVDAAREAAELLGCEVAVPEKIQGTDWCDFRQERLAALRERPLYGARPPSEGNARRAVDGEIAWTMMRAARYLPVSA
jgi:putative DNA primase/helicase